MSRPPLTEQDITVQNNAAELPESPYAHLAALYDEDDFQLPRRYRVRHFDDGVQKKNRH